VSGCDKLDIDRMINTVFFVWVHTTFWHIKSTNSNWHKLDDSCWKAYFHTWMKVLKYEDLLWHLLIKLQVWKYAFQHESSSLCQLEFVDFICQKVVCTQTKKTVLIIRSLVSSIQKVKGHIIVWDLVVPPYTPKERYIW
jgi:hypothetical protein